MMDKSNQLLMFIKDQLANVTIDNLFAWTIGARLFDLGELVPPVRSTAWLGYGAILAQLFAILIFEIAGSTATTMSVWNTPAMVGLVTSIGLLVGWAFVLTGMLFARKRVALPLYTMFLAQITVFGAIVVNEALVLAATVGLAQIAVRVVPRLRQAENLAWGSLLASIVMLGGFGVVVSTRYTSMDAFAGSLNGSMQLAGVFAYGLWFAMGCGVIVTCVRASDFIVQNVRRVFDGRLFQFLVFLALVAMALSEFIFGIRQRDPAWITNGAFGMGLILLALMLWLMRRWNDRNAAIVGGVSLTISLFASSLSVIFADLMHRSNQTASIFPPVLLFLIVAADNLLRFGKPIKSMAPRLGSQIAWVMIYFGLIVIVISALTFLLKYPAGGMPGNSTRGIQNALSGLTLAAMCLSGPVYLLWAVIRRSAWVTLGKNQTTVVSPPQ